MSSQISIKEVDVKSTVKEQYQKVDLQTHSSERQRNDIKDPNKQLNEKQTDFSKNGSGWG